MKIIKYYLKKLKRNVKNFFVGFIVLIIFILSFLSESEFDFETLNDEYGINLNPNDYCNLTDVDYKAILHDDTDGSAKVSITEYLTFDVHAASKNNPFKELWRELPEDNVDGLPVRFKVYSVVQVLNDGTEIEYKETPKMYWEDYDYTPSSTYYWHHSKGSGRYPDNDESLLIYIPWTYRDKLTFKITYDMYNAALKYNDCSELYLSMYSGNSITKLKSFKGQILVPNSIMPKEYYAYSFGTKKSRVPFTQSSSINPGYYTFSINLEESDLKFHYHDRYIEFCLLSYGDDKHIFTQNAPKNRYSNDDVLQECIEENEKYTNLNKTYGIFKIGLLAGAIAFSMLLIDNTKTKIKHLKEKHSIPDPITDYEYFRDIPSDLDPLFAADLALSKDPYDENLSKEEEYAAILLSLSRKKYVTLNKIDETQDWNIKNTLICLNVKPQYANEVTFLHNPDSDTTVKQTITNIISDPPINVSPINNVVHTNIIQGSDIVNVMEDNLFDESLEPLSVSEKLYIDLLIRHSKHSQYRISLSNLQTRIDEDYEYSDVFVKNMEKKPKIEVGFVQGYYQEVEYDKLEKDFIKKSKRSLIIGLILLFIVNLISYFTPLSLAFGAYTIFGIALIYRAIYFNVKSHELLLLTQYGVDERAKWYGLYNFLNSDTLMNEKDINDITIWEKYLIYATAFGISDKVIKAIKIRAVDLNIDQSPILNHHCYIHSTHFHSTSRTFGHSIHTTSHGGHGGWGGYGGGGRGGGGGGGGH